MNMREETDNVRKAIKEEIEALEATYKPLPISQIKWQLGQTQTLMREVLQNGHHYGTIPGCPKPTLLKPGAEILAQMYHLSPDSEITDLSREGVIRYQVKVKLTSRQTGKFIGTGIGECSSDEDKYAWKKSTSDGEWEATAEANRRIKWGRYGDNVTQTKQIRTNPSDSANTILKMAKKRALVDAVLTATCASDIFTQDIEDMDDIGHDAKAQPKSTPPPQEMRSKQNPESKITEKQRQRMYAIAKQSGCSDDIFKKIIVEQGYQSSKDVLVKDYDRIVALFEMKNEGGEDQDLPFESKE